LPQSTPEMLHAKRFAQYSQATTNIAIVSDPAIAKNEP